MRRRDFLRVAGGFAAATCSACHGIVAHAAGQAAHWGYTGETGPENWAKLSTDYAVCGSGSQQSPIDLSGSVPAIVGDPSINWGATALNVVNNGHTIQVNTDPGSLVAISGKPFRLVQFHFHHPSEHGVAGKLFPMEAHFVHAADDGALAVLGVFLEAGADSGLAVDVIDAIWKAAPTKVGQNSVGTRIAPAHLLPADRSLYRYAGSLTTPPCSEIVTWTVYANAIQLTQAQIDTFAKAYPGNARPFQALDRRFVLSNF